MAKYGMSMCVLGMSMEYKGKVGFNALWPRTAISTAAVMNLLGGSHTVKASRKVEIVADACYIILTSDAKTNTGNFYIDDTLLRENGVTEE